MIPKPKPGEVETEDEWEERVLTEDLGEYMTPDGTLDINALVTDSIEWNISTEDE
jgi:hypothetical protein